MFTEEQRALGIEKKEQRKEAGKLLNHDWDEGDKTYWREVAAEQGVRLPLWYLPADATGIRKVLKKLGKDSAWFKDWTGFNSVHEYVEANPGQPLYVFAGTVLEMVVYEASNMVRNGTSSTDFEG